MFFRTKHSTYEVDSDKKRVRRVYGAKTPTDRQGPDGDWRTYTDISEVVVGKPVLILWGIDAKLPILTGKTTITSPVREKDVAFLN